MPKKLLKKHSTSLFTLMVSSILCLSITGCKDSETAKQKDKVVIYTSAEDFRIEYLSKRIQEKFPAYDVTIEYLSTGNHAARLLAEGKNTECDITHDLEYPYLMQLDAQQGLATLKDVDQSIFLDEVVGSGNFVPELRNSGAVIVNTKVLADKGLPLPSSYDDLLKPEYKGLISMPNPKASGTGYTFLKSLVNAWGESQAYAYFDKLTPNILQYTSSGSGPVKALVQEEVAIGLGMTAQAVHEINQGVPLQILFFKEGAPFTLYGQAMIAGKDRKAVKDVFKFLTVEYNIENNEKFFPEQIFKTRAPVIKNYPLDIQYADMTGATRDEKQRLLEKWQY